MVARSYLNNTAVIISCILTASCAGSAPPLPADTTSIDAGRLSADNFSVSDLALSCKAIADEKSNLTDAMRRADSKIVANRKNNQVAGYLGSFAIVPLIAIEHNEEEKILIEKSYARKDILIKLANYKNCGDI